GGRLQLRVGTLAGRVAGAARAACRRSGLERQYGVTVAGARWQGVRALRTAAAAEPGLLRLVIVRLLGSLGDGTVQAALLGVILFSPERETEPAAIATGFAVLLLPYSLLGPFAAAALDRWDR